MITDLWLAQDGLAEGHSIVVDMEGSSLSHLAKVNIISMKKFMYYIQVSLGDWRTNNLLNNLVTRVVKLCVAEWMDMTYKKKN